MTPRGNEIMSQVIISVFVSIWIIISFFMMDLMCIGDVFDDFRRNNYQAVIDIGEFFIWCSHYCVIGGLIGFFGVYMRNFVVNIMGIIWSTLQLPWLMHNITFYQTYYLTTFEGKLFFAEFGVCALVLTISLIGLLRTCLRAYNRRKENQA